VKELQKALKIGTDGFFGPQTEQAVKDFQASHNLPVDGVAGPRTWAKLSAPQAENKSAEAHQAENKSAEAHQPRLTPGASGAAVKELQKALGIQADGFFGPQTEQAAKAFQAAQGLPVDGVVGPRTWARLSPPTESKEADSRAPTPDSLMEELLNMGLQDVELNARLLREFNGNLEQVVAEVFKLSDK
jgi:peptidoglycan hydrolase-like protein with peptidoglycan-binding domain